MIAIALLFCYITFVRHSVGSGRPTIDKSLADDNSVDLPDRGEGLFRHPVEILGQCYPPKRTAQLCESEMTLYAEEVKTVRFTLRGKKLCEDVCRTYQKKMVLGNGVDAQLLKSTCYYIGSDNVNEKIGLDKSCHCRYEIRCDNQAEIYTYTFQPDCSGYLKVSLFKNQFHHYVT